MGSVLLDPGHSCVFHEFRRTDSHRFAGSQGSARCLCNTGCRKRLAHLRVGQSNFLSLGRRSPTLGRRLSRPVLAQVTAVMEGAEGTPGAWGLTCVDYSFYQELRPEEVSVDFLWNQRLLGKLGYLPPSDQAKVQRALGKAFEAHAGQLRKSGEPFITHPVEVTRILGELRLDADTLIAGLLHDTVEDTDYWTFEEIEDQFGGPVRKIVEGETRFSKVASAEAWEEGELEDPKSLDFRHFFTAMTEDVRIILVKLADRLHNMRTMDSMKPSKQKKKASETLKYFAPLAMMLGLEGVTDELQELSLKYLDPIKYNELKEAMETLDRELEKTMASPRQSLQAHLESCPILQSRVNGIVVSVRQKPVYKLYQKLMESGWDLEKNDSLKRGLHFRVMLDLNAEATSTIGSGLCYYVMGLVHKLWTPIPQTMKDFIASPVSGCKKGLVTTVWPKVFDNRLVTPLEVHIQTTAMGKGAGSIPHQLQQGTEATQKPQEEPRSWSHVNRALVLKESDLPVNGNANLNGNGVSHNGGGSGLNGDSDSFAIGDFQIRLWRGLTLDFLRNGNSSGNGNGAMHVNGSSGTKKGLASEPELGSGVQEVLNRNSLDSGDREISFEGAEEWLESVKRWQAEIGTKMSAREFVDCMRDDFLSQSVYVLTPMGEVVQLPKGATTLDFAYHIHTDMGNRTIACKVNGSYVPPHYRLQNAEVVEIFTRDSPPDHAFLDMLRGRVDVVQTKSARRKLKNFVKWLEEQLDEKGGEQNGEQLTSFTQERCNVTDGRTVWLLLECEDRPGILSDVSRLINSHDMSISKYWGYPSSKEDQSFIMRYHLGPSASCGLVQLDMLCSAVSSMPGILSWATGCYVKTNSPHDT